VELAPYADLQHLQKLTNISLNSCHDFEPVQTRYAAPLSHLSAFDNLQHLQLRFLRQSEVPAGLPSQLVKLTCLELSYGAEPSDADYCAQMVQHLSCFTALQQLSLTGSFTTSQVSSIQALSQLTCLQLGARNLEVSTASTKAWAARLTALQSLKLSHCTVDPQVLQTLTQVCALSLTECSCEAAQSLGNPPRRRPFGELFSAVAMLTLLTKLHSWQGGVHYQVLPTADAFTALTASTNLRSLQLCWAAGSVTPPLGTAHSGPGTPPLYHECTLFPPNMVYPNLRGIHLHLIMASSTPLSEQQLQQLGSCCPAVESLGICVREDASPTTCLPLLQLSALTKLAIQRLSRAAVAPTAPGAGEAAAPAATAAVVGIVAQLARLKHLSLFELSSLTDATLLQLTRLTALEALRLEIIDGFEGDDYKYAERMHLTNKVSFAAPTTVS
jgi:hypothetical protein